MGYIGAKEIPCRFESCTDRKEFFERFVLECWVGIPSSKE